MTLYYFYYITRETFIHTPPQEKFFVLYRMSVVDTLLEPLRILRNRAYNKQERTRKFLFGNRGRWNERGERRIMNTTINPLTGRPREERTILGKAKNNIGKFLFGTRERRTHIGRIKNDIERKLRRSGLTRRKHLVNAIGRDLPFNQRSRDDGITRGEMTDLLDRAHTIRDRISGRLDEREPAAALGGPGGPIKYQTKTIEAADLYIDLAENHGGVTTDELKTQLRDRDIPQGYLNGIFQGTQRDILELQRIQDLAQSQRLPFQAHFTDIVRDTKNMEKPFEVCWLCVNASINLAKSANIVTIAITGTAAEKARALEEVDDIIEKHTNKFNTVRGYLNNPTIAQSLTIRNAITERMRDIGLKLLGIRNALTTAMPPGPRAARRVGAPRAIQWI